MLLTAFFTNMYELFIGHNSDYPEYRTGVFSGVGLLTFILAAVICLIFYAGIGRWRPVFHKPVHWIYTLSLVGLLAFAFALARARNATNVSDTYTVSFALFNGLYAAFYFVICSLIFKRLSIFAKHTPIRL